MHSPHEVFPNVLYVLLNPHPDSYSVVWGLNFKDFTMFVIQDELYGTKGTEEEFKGSFRKNTSPMDISLVTRLFLRGFTSTGRLMSSIIESFPPLA